MIEEILKRIGEIGNSFIDSILKVFSLIFLMLQDIKPVLLGVAILIVADQVTGVWKAINQKSFNWKTFKKLYIKLILYLGSIILAYIYEGMILGIDEYYLTKGVGAVVGFQELSSFYLNVSAITGKDYLSKFIKTKNPLK